MNEGPEFNSREGFGLLQTQYVLTEPRDCSRCQTVSVNGEMMPDGTWCWSVM